MRKFVSKRLEKLRKLLKENEWEAVILTLNSNFSWITGGLNNKLRIDTQESPVSIIITLDKVLLFTSNIETHRMREEEHIKFEVIEYKWYESIDIKWLKQKLKLERIVSDTGIFGTLNINSLIRPLRYQFASEEIKEYISLGKICTKIVEDTAYSLNPEKKEIDIAAEIMEKCFSKEIIPSIILVAGEDRINLYRHPFPKNVKIKKRCMLVLGAKKYGLTVNLTRLINFSKLSSTIKRRHTACVYVDATYILNTKPGVKVSDIIKKGKQAYEKKGYKREFYKHHQGGATGYNNREYLGTLNSTEVVIKNQPFAWNPSIEGTKSEDTIIAQSHMPLIITHSERWPMVHVSTEYGAIDRPDILVL